MRVLVVVLAGVFLAATDVRFSVFGFSSTDLGAASLAVSLGASDVTRNEGNSSAAAAGSVVLCVVGVSFKDTASFSPVLPAPLSSDGTGLLGGALVALCWAKRRL